MEIQGFFRAFSAFRGQKRFGLAMESIFKLGILIKLTDSVSGPVMKIGKGIDQLKYKAEAMGQTFEDFQKYGAYIAVGGAVILAALAGTVKSTVASEKALGELSSVGVKDLRALEVAGQEFSNTWSGTTKAQFISAAYDIKGGIASLSDAGVAEFAKLAALTAKGTKSSTQEMTSLFATAYGIYKDQYAQLSDMQFGQMFSGGISAAVNIFKSTGSGMAGAIENLGAAATVAKRPLEEQLTVLGMLQATMSGREAGTAYKAFIRDVDSAGKKLGMNFYDAAGNLKSIDQIMGMLRGKFGDLSGKESAVLQKAFTDESYRLVAQMYTKVDNLTGNIKLMSDAMGQGTIYTEQMASAMNKDIGAGMGILGNRIHNLVEILGKQLIPVLAPLFAWLGNCLLEMQKWAEAHPRLTQVIMVSVGILGLLLFVLGGVLAVIGTIGLAVPAVITGMGLVAGAFTTATAAAWGFTTALLANPITWIVVAVAAAVGVLILVYNKLEDKSKMVVQFVMFFVGYLLGLIVKIGVGFTTALTHPLLFLQSLLWGAEQIIGGLWNVMFTSGQKIVSTLVSGIKSMALAPVDAMKSIFGKIRNLLPFSDAKEGPLSQLTLSGSRIMSTLGSGITGAAPGLHRAMATALAGVALTTSINATPDRSGRSEGKQVVIQQMTVQISSVSDAKDFIQQLQALVEGHDVD